nr:hypothetical protein CFP56_00391 [Quercus suber]
MHRTPGFLGIVKRAKDWTLPTRCTVPQSTSEQILNDNIDETFEIVDHESTSPLFQADSVPQRGHASQKARKVKMGGKSNKFDYTNRSSTGYKLGQIIGHALEKEATKLQKAADKEAEKLRKQSCGSSTTTSDDIGHIHVVDLQAPDKCLGDDGLCALAGGLKIALRSGTRLAIEDLNLSGNALTTASLQLLAPIIRLAKHDLKTLNLSNNNIRVETDGEAAQWQAFMQSFGECFRLRRLDLRNNGELGSRAMEILTRIHTREAKIDPIAPDWNDSVLSFLSDHDAKTPGEEVAELEEGDRDEGRLAVGQVLRNRRGLRSIPYIELNNTGLTDAGALWLSYVVQDHYYPTQLTDGLNATAAASVISAYQQDRGISGVSWDEVADASTKDARTLLRKTEAVRYRTMLEKESVCGESLLEDGDHIEGQQSDPRGKQSLERKLSNAIVRDRKGSMRSIRTMDGGEHEMTELESLRRRIQRHMIDHDGVRSVELWHAALALVTYSRYLQWLMASKQTLLRAFAFSSQQKVLTSSVSRTEPRRSGQTIKRHNENAKQTAPSVKGSESYARTLIVPTDRMPSDAELALTEVTNIPTTPKKVFKPHRKGAFSESSDSDLSAVTEKLRGPIMRVEQAERFVKYQKERIATATDAQSNSELACSMPSGQRLPQNTIELILAAIIPPQQISALSTRQKMAAWQWGQNCSTLATEMEWRKHDRSSQVWMLLEKVGCLAYDEN